jgi:hypothetical protein
MKKIIYIGILLLLSIPDIGLSRNRNRFSANEVGVSLRGGVSGVFFNTSAQQISAKPDFGSSLSFVYYYTFHPNWSLGLDAGISYSAIQTVSNAIEQTQWKTYMFDTLTTIGKNSRLERLTERQTMLNLSLGIMLRYNTLWKKKMQYYFEFGGKLNGTVWNVYNANAHRLVTSGDFPEFSQYLENMPSHSFINISNVNYKGESVFSKPHFFITLEAGIKHIITSKTFFNIGLFIDCGAVNIAKNNSTPLIDYNPNIFFGPEDPPEFKYAGIFQTDIIKNSKMLMIFAGIKLQFTFKV